MELTAYFFSNHEPSWLQIAFLHYFHPLNKFLVLLWVTDRGWKKLEGGRAMRKGILWIGDEKRI